MYRIRTHAPRAALAIALAAAIALAGALLPGLPGADLGPFPPPPAHAAHTPTITASVTSTAPGNDSVYSTGDTITIRTTWNTCVASVTSGTLTITMDSGTVSAAVTGTTTNTTTIDFSHTVVSGNLDQDGIAVATGALGGTYSVYSGATCSGASHAPAATTLSSALSAQTSHAVNTVDYDADNDGLIEITSLAQLVELESDPDGNGDPSQLSWWSGNEVTDYNSAFSNRKTSSPGRNGCYRAGPPVNTNCRGYELMADLDFDTNDDGQITSADTYPNWRPISVQDGFVWRTTFQGNGHTISNLRSVNAVLQSFAGMFGRTNSGTHITGVGLENAVVASDRGYTGVGPLVGQLNGGATVSDSWASGTVSGTVSGDSSYQYVGGLVGDMNGGTIRNSYSSATVNLPNSRYAVGGGLVGEMNGGQIIASYATGTVSGGMHVNHERPSLGGLVGYQNGGAITASYANSTISSNNQAFIGGLVGAQRHGSITASYSISTISSAAGSFAGGLLANPGSGQSVQGNNYNSIGSVTDSYWDTTASAHSPTTSDRGQGLTTAELQGTTDYTGIYASWNHNTDGVAGPDDPWYFGTSTQYPHLKRGLTLTELLDFYGETPPASAVDYDATDNGLIDISTLAQLDAVRYDLDGSGADGLAGDALLNYQLAFPGALDGMGCPDGPDPDADPGDCTGYELTADLDFLGSQWSAIGGGGLGHRLGWRPIGGGAGYNGSDYTADFHGNGHTISNLYIRDTNRQHVGLFYALVGGDYSGIGLVDADVTHTFNFAPDPVVATFANTGALAGILVNGRVYNSYSTGRVAYHGTGAAAVGRTGGLVGTTWNDTGAGQIAHLAACWSAATVLSQSDSTWANAPDIAGGLLGLATAGTTVYASYASGAVASTAAARETRVGGLVGNSDPNSNITASYAAAPVSYAYTGSGTAGGVGPLNTGSATITDSYYDSDVAGTFASTPGDAKTTAELQTPTAADGYAGIYADWDLDIDGADGNNDITDGVDDPWEFGTSSQYPILKFPGAAGAAALQRPTLVSYDTDGDGLIDISSLAQLDAVRYDLDGNGWATASDRAAYRTAFPNGGSTMGCPGAGCIGYELAADLDFAGSAYAAAPGWTPLGVDAAGAATAYSAVFEGNNRTISNLFIELTTATTAGGGYVGLFGSTSGTVRNVGLVNPSISNTRSGGGSPTTGALIGEVAANGVVSDSYVQGGTVSVAQAAAGSIVSAGCLAGWAYEGAAFNDSWASCALTGSGSVANGELILGGLVGFAGPNNRGNAAIADSYATGTVTAAGAIQSHIGGLVGQGRVAISRSYATGAVQNQSAHAVGHSGGLIGRLLSTSAAASGSIAGSYATGAVTAASQYVGGLAGRAQGVITGSYAAGAVDSTSTATSGQVGGLIGQHEASGSGAPAGSITGSHASGAVVAAAAANTGGLVGRAYVDITSSYATGAVTSNRTTDTGSAGGLVGHSSDGDIKASYALGNVTAVGPNKVGGLIGRADLGSDKVIQAAYAHGAVSRTSATGTGGEIGGLVGLVSMPGGTTTQVQAVYAIGAVTAVNLNDATFGLFGAFTGNTGGIAHAYWNSDDAATDGTGGTGQSLSYSCGGTCDQYVARTGSALQTPIQYGGIYLAANWNLNIDGDTSTGTPTTGLDDPWNFGTMSQYPILTFGHDVRSIAAQRGQPAGTMDYDANDNNLIDIGAAVAGLHQLNAIRHDLAGVGDAGATGAAAVAYLEAFPGLRYGMGCPTGCQGYELTADLDFDDNGDGAVDRDDEYGNWEPLTEYKSTFDGQGHTIANLTISRTGSSGEWIGLFAGLNGADAVIRSVGLLNPSVTVANTAGPNNVGALAGQSNNGAQIYAVYVRGGSITTSSTNTVVGGLLGRINDTGTSITASYALGTAINVSGSGTYHRAGGLVGGLYDGGNITASYAASPINLTATSSVTSDGALVALLFNDNATSTVTNSYYDSTVEASAGGTGTGQSTEDLQTPTDYETGATPPGIYAAWNLDLDGDGNADDPWDFGTDSQYPVLQFGYTAAGIAAQRPLDYDDNDNGLIEITTPAQLDAVRYDLQGDGAAAADDQATYRAAFANAEIGMGCNPAPPADGCSGYELKANIDLAGYPNWDPIGGSYAATFDGEGYAISNLRITDAGKNSVGLFSNLGNAAVVEKVALVDVDIAESWAAGDPALSLINAGALAGFSQGTIRYSYATGRIGVTVTDTSSAAPAVQAGGLVGSLFDRGVIAGSWADVAVTVTSSSGRSGADLVGGLVGRQTGQDGIEASYIVASYAKGAVAADRDPAAVGGLVGQLVQSDANVRASYSIGSVAAHASADTGGLVGDNSGTVTDSYFDFEAAGFPAGTLGKSTSDLKGASGYTGDYSGWNVDVDNDDGGGYGATGVLAGVDDPWYFGTNTEYPILDFRYNASSISRQQGVDPVNSYDTNGNDLIEVSNLAQLNAIRYDLDGDGDPDESTDIAAYLGAYRGPLAGMGCPNGCEGYELVADLDFAGSDYASGAGWAPIASANDEGYTGKFVGNGHTIANLYINYTTGTRPAHGLFGNIGDDAAAAGEVSGVGLPNASVTVANTALVGTLAGRARTGSVITASWATGSVTSTSTAPTGTKSLGGLVGHMGDNNTAVRGSWAAVTVTANAAAGVVLAGGLVGRITDDGDVLASYATGAVSGGQGSQTNNGGLVGSMAATITASYATGAVSVGTGGQAGGLVGVVSSGTAPASYWDNQITGTSAAGTGQTRSALQSTDDYTVGNIYATWDDYDVDGETGPDAPWDFLAANQYPILTLGHSAASIAAQTNPQNTELLNIIKPANVDEVVRVGDAWTLEIQPTVVSVDLPRTAFTVRSTAADAVVVTDIDPLPGDGTPDAWTPADYTGGNTMIGLTPALSETESVVTVRVTSPNGLSTQDYMVTILRIFCPKAEITGPANIVGEGGSADFTILVCGTTTEPVIVSWAVDTEASTADGADLGRALTGTITVPTGDDREATLSFPITDDDTPEPSETITVRITGVTGGTTRIDMRPAMATIALSDPSLDLRAPEGTGTGGAGDTADAPLTASSMLVLTEGAGRSYSLRLATETRESVTIVIHSNHEGVTTTPDRVTFNAGNWRTPQRVTVNAAQDGDDNHDRATLTHILTDEDGSLLEIIDRIPLFVTDTDPPDDDDIC